MPVAPLVSSENGVPFLVSAGIVYEIIAAACSSPQTTEINADKRAETLMKWVYVGEVQAALFVAAAAYCDPQYAKEYLIGGLAAGGLMHCSYLYARNCGMK